MSAREWKPGDKAYIEPTDRDDLVTLPEQHEGYDCICGEWSGSYPERHLADVLIAAGWTKGDA